MAEQRSVGIVGAGIFGLSLAVALSSKKGHNVTVFDRYRYDESGYAPDFDDKVQAASVDHNKIFRASYGSKIHYQRLAVESRQCWEEINASLRETEVAERGLLFNACGMLRVQPTDQLSDLEKETLGNMEQDGLRQTQFVRGLEADRLRARDFGWEAKMLEFDMPPDDESSPNKSFGAVLDSLAGFIRCSDACNYFYKKAAAQGVVFHFGPDKGAFECLVEEQVGAEGRKKATGLKTKDGITHKFDVVVIAAGSFSTQLLPELAYHLESSAGSLATFKVDKQDTALWDKYSPERFPVITWGGFSRRKGADAGSIYVLPRTPEGLVKIGYRGTKFTNFQPAPDSASFSQDGLWSVPLSPSESLRIQEDAARAVREFVSIFLPDFDGKEFYSTKMCWYTDSLDNSFLIDYAPTYAERSVFVCTGGSGHGAKFLPVLGEHAADILAHGEQSSSYMSPHWRWREHIGRGNGLDEGPGGPRNIGKSAA